MRKLLFKNVSVNSSFFFEGYWYVKVDPKMTGLNVAINALDTENQSRGFWFEDNEVVEQ